jgi:hypothetical protein
LVVRTLHPLGSMRAPRCPSRLTTLQVGFGGMCIYTLREKGIRREYCDVRGANVEEVGETDIEETKLPTPVLRIYGASVVPCPQLRPTIVACSGAAVVGDHKEFTLPRARALSRVSVFQ